MDGDIFRGFGAGSGYFVARPRYMKTSSINGGPDIKD